LFTLFSVFGLVQGTPRGGELQRTSRLLAKKGTAIKQKQQLNLDRRLKEIKQSVEKNWNKD
jgi:hypothetical protein